MPRFVELVRVSSGAQAARESPEDQRRALDALRSSRPGDLVERIDSVVSGASDDRGDLARLFALLSAGKVDEVRVRHIDRLTRHPDPRQRAAVLGALMDARAVVVEASGRVIDPADEMGELDLSLQGWMASRERRRILERTLAARKRLAAEGKIQGRPPFARTWNKRTGVWGVEPKALALYRRLYADLLAGATLGALANALNAEGIPTPRGREWTPSHVSRLLRRRDAVGELRGWGQTFRIPAVVDEGTWRAAQEAIARNRREQAGPKGHHPALLRRLLACGECGQTMWVQRGGRSDDRSSFYVCRSYRTAENDGCRKWHAVEAVDEAVKADVLADARDSRRIRRAAQKGAPEAERPEDDIAAAEKELADLERQEERLARLMRRGMLSERVAAKQLAEVGRLRHAAEVDLVTAKARADALERERKASADLAARAERIRRGLERAGFKEWREFLVRAFPPPGSIRLYADGRISLRRMAAAATRAG